MSEPTVDERKRASRFLVFLLGVLGVVSLLVVAPFLTGIIFALVLGFLLQRPYRATLRVARWRPVAATLVVLGVLVAIIAPLALLVFELVQEAQGLAAGATQGELAARAEGALVSLGVPPESAADVLQKGAAGAAEALKGAAIPTLSAIASFLVNLGVFVFLLYYVLIEGPALLEFVKRAMQLPDARCDHLFTTVGGRVRALFLGTFAVALVQGVVSTIGWWILGFPHVIFWGFVMTALAVLPAVGPTLVMVPAGIYAIATGDLFHGIALIAWGAALVPIVDNVARAYIVGRSADVHPAVVLLGTLGGLALFGATGFVLGPLLLSMVEPVLGEWEIARAEALAPPVPPDA